MARSVHQILGLLGTKDPAAVLVYPLPSVETPAPAEVPAEVPAEMSDDSRDRALAWAGVWGADFGRLTASVTTAEKEALVAAGAREQASRA